MSTTVAPHSSRGRAAPCFAVALAAVILPPQFTEGVESRILAAEDCRLHRRRICPGFPEDEDTSTGSEKCCQIRRLYGDRAMDGDSCRPKLRAERLQRSRCVHGKHYSGPLSVGHLVAILPVFSRYKHHTFFRSLALAVRAGDSRRRSPKQLPVQSAMVAMLLANLVISTYPHDGISVSRDSCPIQYLPISNIAEPLRVLPGLVGPAVCNSNCTPAVPAGRLAPVARHSGGYRSTLNGLERSESIQAMQCRGLLEDHASRRPPTQRMVMPNPVAGSLAAA